MILIRLSFLVSGSLYHVQFFANVYLFTLPYIVSYRDLTTKTMSILSKKNMSASYLYTAYRIRHSYHYVNQILKIEDKCELLKR